MLRGLIAVLAILASSAAAQQLPDTSKLAPVYQQQRNAEADGRAQCYALLIEAEAKFAAEQTAKRDLQARVAELEKQLAEATAAKKD